MGCVSSSNDINKCYHLQKVKLGEGSFGVVWRAVHRNSGEVVAIKQLRKDRLKERRVSRSDVEREIDMMQKLDHENIIRLDAHFEDPDSIYLAVEYCDSGDFGDKVLERGSNMREPEVAFWVKQMLEAVAFMHTKRIVHRDIKPDNFLIAQGNRLKLADLGLATACPVGNLLSEKCGTPAFMAPEQHRLPWQSRGYGLEVDVWAAGVCMYTVMTGGKHPFVDVNKTLLEKRLLAGELEFHRDRFRQVGLVGGLNLGSSRMSSRARSLCHEMVDVDARKRITAEAALSKPWFDEFSDSLEACQARSVDSFAPAPVAQEELVAPMPRLLGAKTTGLLFAQCGGGKKGAYS